MINLGGYDILKLNCNDDGWFLLWIIFKIIIFLDPDFEQLLLAALDRTKTVGICNIYSVNLTPITNTNLDRQFLSYGFVHYLANQNRPSLCLSVFDQGCCFTMFYLLT